MRVLVRGVSAGMKVLTCGDVGRNEGVGMCGVFRNDGVGMWGVGRNEGVGMWGCRQE